MEVKNRYNSKKLWLNYRTVSSRINTYWWSIEKALELTK